MSERSGIRRLWPQLLCALAIGIVAPHAELAWKCRQGFESSEACVWGRSYFPLVIWLEPLLVAPTVFAALVCLTWAWSRWRGGRVT